MIYRKPKGGNMSLPPLELDFERAKEKQAELLALLHHNLIAHEAVSDEMIHHLFDVICEITPPQREPIVVYHMTMEVMRALEIRARSIKPGNITLRLGEYCIKNVNLLYLLCKEFFMQYSHLFS